MTESEWLACDDPRPMLENLHGEEHDRQRRLFATATTRRVVSLLPARASFTRHGSPCCPTRSKRPAATTCRFSGICATRARMYAVAG